MISIRNAKIHIPIFYSQWEQDLSKLWMYGAMQAILHWRNMI